MTESQEGEEEGGEGEPICVESSLALKRCVGLTSIKAKLLGIGFQATLLFSDISIQRTV